MYNVVLLLGSNLGNAENNILLALSELEKRAGKIIKKTKILRTSPVEFDSKNILLHQEVSLISYLSQILVSSILQVYFSDLIQKLFSEQELVVT